MFEELITVIMTCFNSDEKFLTQAINSVLNQTYSNYEFIIIDDGSTNNVLDKVIMKFNSNKIKLIKQSNAGLCNARNTGIKNSKGKYIAFIDDDDIWLSNKLEESYKFFEEIKKNDSNVGLIFSQSEIIDEDNNIHGVYGFLVSGNIYRKILGKNIIGPPSSVFIEKKCLDYVGYFNEKFIYAEDIELWYRIAREYNVYSLNKPLIQYRYRRNSLSKNYEKMAYYTEKALYIAIEKSNNMNLDINNILSKYYIDFAYLFFSNNNSRMYRKYYYNAIKYRYRNIFNLKLLFALAISMLGDNLMQRFNKIRRKKYVVPPSYLKIYNYI